MMMNSVDQSAGSGGRQVPVIQTSRYNAGHNRRVVVRSSSTLTQVSELAVPSRRAAHEGFFDSIYHAIRRALCFDTCMTATSVDQGVSAGLTSATAGGSLDGSAGSVGRLVENLMHRSDSSDIQSVEIQSTRMKEKPGLFRSRSQFHGEFFDIGELRQDICNYLALKPDVARRHSIFVEDGQVELAQIPRSFYLAKPADEKAGVSAEDIFTTLRVAERAGGTGPSDSLKRYMLCQLLSVKEINTQFREHSAIDLEIENLYEQGSDIAAKLLGFIANNDTKPAMMEYLREPSLTVKVVGQDMQLSPIAVIKFLKQPFLSTSGTGKKIQTLLKEIVDQFQQNPAERARGIDETIQFISHGPEGGDAQGVLMAIGSPIPQDKMGLAAALVFDVTRTFPNPNFSDDQKEIVDSATEVFSARAESFVKKGNVQFCDEDNINGRAFLIAHKIIDDEGTVLGPKGPVTGHFDTVYFTNSKEDSLEHMLKKSMLVNGIMALGKDNIINKASANDQLNQILHYEVKNAMGRVVEI